MCEHDYQRLHPAGDAEAIDDDAEKLPGSSDDGSVAADDFSVDAGSVATDDDGVTSQGTSSI